MCLEQETELQSCGTELQYISPPNTNLTCQDIEYHIYTKENDTIIHNTEINASNNILNITSVEKKNLIESVSRGTLSVSQRTSCDVIQVFS